MRTLGFDEAVDDALAQAMAADPTIVVFGEDVPVLRANLLLRFGRQRVWPTPISEAAFVGAAVGAAMAGLRPVVELMMIDFIGVTLDALLSQAAKVETFSGGNWRVPLVVRATCGGGYGDAGQHEQTLWGLLAHIPGLCVVVPSTPADAGALLLGALEARRPVIYLEHKLLSRMWLEALGAGGRTTITFDVPEAGARGPVPETWAAAPLGVACSRRTGSDLTLVSVGVGVHRCLEAAAALEGRGLSAAVLDLRSVAPLDRDAIRAAAGRTGRLLVVDEDYQGFGLSGEVAAVALEAGIPVQYGRVCTCATIPYSSALERQILPNTARIVEASVSLVDGRLAPDRNGLGRPADRVPAHVVPRA